MMNIDTLIITHGLKGLPNYAFSGNDLYVLENCKGKRTQPTKRLSIQLNGLTRGYFIDRKFRSLTWIERRMYPIIKIVLKQTYKPF